MFTGVVDGVVGHLGMAINWSALSETLLAVTTWSTSNMRNPQVQIVDGKRICI